MDLLQIQALADRVRAVKTKRLNEANTKSSLIMPFLQAMGYDVFDHEEVVQEYTAEWGTKKGEKVDIAVLKNGEPVILIECKPFNDPLDTGKCSQLFRYFTTLPARIGILTDGRRYLFFSDFEKQNIMDGKPFMEIDLLDFNERDLPQLQKLTKMSWDLDGILSSAETLKYTRAVKLLITEDASEPSEGLVRYYASQCYDGKITTKIVELFRPVVKRAIAEHISDEIARRLETVRQVKEPIPPQLKDETEDVSSALVEHNLPVEPCTGKDGIVTHNTEVWAYVIIRTLLRDDVAPSRITMRDQKSYCGILLDNNNRKPICRLYNFEHFDWGMENIGDHAHIVILTEGNERGERYNLRYVDDIYPLADRLKAALRRHEPEGNENFESERNVNE